MEGKDKKNPLEYMDKVSANRGTEHYGTLAVTCLSSVKTEKPDYHFGSTEIVAKLPYKSLGEYCFPPGQLCPLFPTFINSIMSLSFR